MTAGRPYLGDRLDATSRYYKHPAAGTGPWIDGGSLDAGTAWILENNVNHLLFESLNPLVQDMGPGALTSYADFAALAAAGGDSGVGLVESTSLPAVMLNPWRSDTSRRYGPFPGFISDVISGVATLPTIKAQVTCGVTNTGTSSVCTLILAVSSSPIAPAFDTAALYHTSDLVATASFVASSWPTQKTLTITPTVRLTLSSGVPMRCRKDASVAGASTTSMVIPIWIHLGYLSHKNGLGGSDPSARIGAISVFETRSLS